MKTISPEAFCDLARSIVGMPVGRAWNGGGSAIFLELGSLSDVKRLDGAVRQTGEVTLMIDWSWRVEGPRSIRYGSWSKNEIIHSRIPELKGAVVQDVSVDGRLPEIAVALDRGRYLRSFMTTDSQPAWCLFLGKYAYYVARGKIVAEERRKG